MSRPVWLTFSSKRILISWVLKGLSCLGALRRGSWPPQLGGGELKVAVGEVEKFWKFCCSKLCETDLRCVGTGTLAWISWGGVIFGIFSLATRRNNTLRKVQKLDIDLLYTLGPSAPGWWGTLQDKTHSLSTAKHAAASVICQAQP